MLIYARIGTLPSQMVRVLKRRKPPKVGETIYISDILGNSSLRVRIIEIKEILDETLYIMERF